MRSSAFCMLTFFAQGSRSNPWATKSVEPDGTVNTALDLGWSIVNHVSNPWRPCPLNVQIFVD